MNALMGAGVSESEGGLEDEGALAAYFSFIILESLMVYAELAMLLKML